MEHCVLLAELSPKNRIMQDVKPHVSESLLFLLRFGSFQCYIFYSNGSYQYCIGNSHLSAISLPSISRSIRHICKLVLEHNNVEISFPNAKEHYNTIKMGFQNKFGIKGVVGAIDCTHVSIIGPSSSSNVIPHEYMNRKGYYSINVEAICDD
ncbi:putative nuclease HARBI1 [Bactrocera dorsalis]|uniref:Nuclease HARBI1 n=1 Tax=Bactrocera dorsalis TaxID=27457 RepID=A0A6I9UZW8_BACDO|nr:putative nuclease HARBI1 [Bactrocera dorsalis]